MPTSDLWRRPRLSVIANGTPLAGVESAEIVTNNHLAADRFRMTAALADPAISRLVDQPTIYVAIGLTTDASPITTVLTGEVDSLEIDLTGGLVRFEGRDLSARLIEARTQETFANKTASEIAAELAGRHGLTPDVQATTTPVGRYWQLEHDSITLDQFGHARSEWDLLVSLAAHESFDVWVSGATLHFRPSVVAPAAPQVTLRTRPTLNGAPNVTSLRLERALTLAKDIEVEVKSWNSRQQTAFVQRARSRGGAGRSASRLRYSFVVPNLTGDEALKLAQRKLAEISSHERIILAEMPGELALAPRATFAVEGTGTQFDQAYVVDEIERRFEFSGGFTQRIRGRTCSAS